MSWSISKTGHAGAIGAAVRAAAAQSKLSIQSEADCRERIVSLIGALAADAAPREVVRVEASGSAYVSGQGTIHSAKLSFETLYGGFAELPAGE
jgi:hypothetical protein